MGVISTLRSGITIRRTVKNMRRFRVIASVLGRHGFDEVLIRMNLARFIPEHRRAEGVESMSIGEKLRRSFEILGPTFVKLGQILSTRPDMLPDDIILELSKLQDKVAPIPFEEAKKVFELESRKKLEETFSYFSEIAIASASIGQVHEARLLSGEKVVVKIQRPGIDVTIKQDIAILKFFAGLLEKYIPEIRFIDPQGILEEFHKTLLHELNYTFEAANAEKFRKNFSAPNSKESYIVIPKIYSEFTTSKTLVMEKIEGVRLNDIEALTRLGVDKSEIAKRGAMAFFKMVMEDGFFHGDLHPGNFFLLPENKIALIDFGIVGRLDKKTIDRFASIVLNLVNENFERLAFEYADIGAVDTAIDFDKFVNDLRYVAAPYMGLPLKDINIGQILLESIRVAVKYNIKIPPEWTTLIRALIGVEGLGKSLDPNFDIMGLASEITSRILKNRYNPKVIADDLMWIMRDYKSLIEILPRNFRWMMKKFSKDGFTFKHELRGLEELKTQSHENGKLIAHSVITAGLFIAGSMAASNQNSVKVLGLPFGSSVMFFFGGFLLLILLFRLLK